MSIVRTILECLKVIILAYCLVFTIGATASVATEGIENFGLRYFYAVLAGSLLLTSILALVIFRSRKEESLPVLGILRIVNRAQCFLILTSVFVTAWFVMKS